MAQLAAPLGSTVTPQDVTRLASDLAAIMTGVTGDRISADTISDAEADALFPPRTGAEASMRGRAVAAAASTLADTPDDDLYALIWPVGPQRYDHGGLRRVVGGDDD